MLRFSAACFWFPTFADVSPWCVYIILSSVSVAQWPPFGKKLLTRLTICSICILTICNISYFPFLVFEGWSWVLIASVPDFCILVTLLPAFGVRVSVTFHLTRVHIIFSSVWIAVWPPFGK